VGVVDRWVLSRAGIVNVYQYGDETLHFHGGRLLLRGVNGSGKSTAMNMLLPFLLDTDTRRIDAAGEQSGVLRSWMLADRDEHQPVGYLWIELRRGDRYTTMGCGIRANRATDRVTTWWFVTQRRPGIDLALVQSRTPLSIDTLRAELGNHAVFAHDQRAAYRAMVRETLFGGADIDQHIRLLHILRNPRVGDRIDLDLPQYLEDALPQLSEAALDDAAQPLEDLEEHRRNVEELTHTSAALDALEAVYRNYARAELHRRSQHVRESADLAAERRRAERGAAKAHAAAVASRDAAETAVGRLEADHRRLTHEIEGLKESDAYKQGVELNTLRAHVGSLEREVAGAKSEVATREERLDTARVAVDQTSSQAEDDLEALRQQLSDLAAVAITVGLPRRPPGPPLVDTGPSPVDGVEVPMAAVDVEPVRAGIGLVRADLRRRLGDVGSVRAALDAVDRADLALRAATTAEGSAAEGEQKASAAFTASRNDLAAAVDSWRQALSAWVDQVDAHRLVEGLPAVDGEPLRQADLATARDQVVEHLRQVLDDTTAHHRAIVATLTARREAEQATVDDLDARLVELQARTLPDPPAVAWQRPDRAPCLAELVDFEPSLDPTARAGIEAALEAAGLLSAEVVPGAGLALADGQLLAVPGRRAHQTLSRHLRLAVPDELRDRVDLATVVAITDAISTDPEDLTAEADVPVITVDGRFRAGALRGRHTKAEAEHVGVGARRAALERQRAAVAVELDDARAVLARTDGELAERRERLDDVAALRSAMPPQGAVTDAVTDAAVAELALDQARDALHLRRGERIDADRQHAEAVDSAGRTAADHGLPVDRAGLDQVAAGINEARGTCAAVEGTLAALVRSVAGWIGQGVACDRAADDLQAARAKLARLSAEHEPAAARLAALEDAVGLPSQEVQAAITDCARELDAATSALDEARNTQLTAHGEVRAQAQRREAAVQATRSAEGACVAALPTLARALEVPGLVASAVPPAAPPHDDVDGSAAPDRAGVPVVPATVDGARQLVDYVVELIPTPADPAAGAESVRLSLRQRRDALGAGWDAEDRQPDEALPVHVEVTGPLGRMPLHESAERAEAQRRSMAGLLSAKQDQALRNLLQGLIAREVATKLHAARELVKLMNDRLDTVRTSHGIGVSLRWQKRDDLDHEHAEMVGLLAKAPDLRTADEEHRLTGMVAARIAEARSEDPDAGYRDLIARVLDYRRWHRMALLLRRPGRSDERLNRRTALSEGEKKMVSYLPLFAAVAASCDALAEQESAAPRFVLLDDAFAKVSEDNHANLFGLLVEMDLDFVATSERLWGTHETVPELAITEVLRDATLGVIVLEHSRWDGRIGAFTSTP
jgi:uncharacterized protein (TIGR02680 family)